MPAVKKHIAQSMCTVAFLTQFKWWSSNTLDLIKNVWWLQNDGKWVSVAKISVYSSFSLLD